jgi:hypothetical protein
VTGELVFRLGEAGLLSATAAHGGDHFSPKEKMAKLACFPRDWEPLVSRGSQHKVRLSPEANLTAHSAHLVHHGVGLCLKEFTQRLCPPGAMASLIV